MSLARMLTITYSIKKPKTFRYPSLKGTDPKFRRNHKHALHGTMRALKEVKEGKRDAA
jgi:large subunit ribosomal protein L29e